MRCTLPNCDRPHKAKGFCCLHYQRHASGIDLNAPVRQRAAPGALMAWVDAHLRRDDFSDTECVEWPFSVNAGYPSAGDKRLNRVVCEHFHGSPIEGSVAAHKPIACNNKLCLNPLHLRWATAAENNADKLTDGLVRRGESHPSAVVSEVEALSIKCAEGRIADIARTHGVSWDVVSRIRKGKTWKHLPDRAEAALIGKYGYDKLIGAMS